MERAEFLDAVVEDLAEFVDLGTGGRMEADHAVHVQRLRGVAGKPVLRGVEDEELAPVVPQKGDLVVEVQVGEVGQVLTPLNLNYDNIYSNNQKCHSSSFLILLLQQKPLKKTPYNPKTMNIIFSKLAQAGLLLWGGGGGGGIHFEKKNPNSRHNSNKQQEFAPKNQLSAQPILSKSVF